MNGWDLAVIGAGTAGLPCAIAAERARTRVLLLEQAASIGGTRYLTGGHSATGEPSGAAATRGRAFVSVGPASTFGRELGQRLGITVDTTWAPS